MSAHLEIEKKYLVGRLPSGLKDCRNVRIEQGYVASEGARAEVRVRRQEGQLLLGLKSGGGIVRSETEIELTEEQFEAIWSFTSGRRLVKTRYFVPWNHVVLEIDVYEEGLDGLVVAEVEFDSEREAEVFRPPEWFGREISGDRRYKNVRLCEDGVPEEDGPVRGSRR